ncbi:hypothetical protein NKH10_19365 [Mesorhizobium sp. M1340]|uniref:hypothetical protein n=1 Tax=Mesorhizobium sp. M1340 TaxID=2957087 RepID=UPI00333CBA9E
MFPGKISTSVGTRNAYVHADGDVVVMCVGEDAEERAEAVARAIAAHDKLVTMATFLQPSFGVDGIRVTIAAEAFNHLESMLHSARLRSAKLADLAGEADHLCQLALAEVIGECDKVRAELKATGHASEGDSLHRLVDAALDEERCRCNEEVAKLRGRLNAIREAAAA